MPEVNKVKIGVLAPNKKFFGAQIVSIPFYANLRKLYPGAHITVISPVDTIGLLDNLGLIDEVKICDLSGGLKDFFDTLGFIRKNAFDYLFTFRRKSERDWFLNIFSGVKNKTGFKRKWSSLVYDFYTEYDKNKYRGSNFTELLKTVDNDSIIGYEPVFSEHKCKTGETIWLIPCGSKEEKLWPIDSYIELAGQIIEKLDKKVTFVLGESEKSFLEHIHNKLSGYSNSVEYLVEESVESLLGEVNNCIASVSNDCGPGHIPQISGCKSLVLFAKGANIYEWVNTEAGGVEIISPSENIADITVEKVFKTLTGLE
jgi:ADP-heptose:LPS heptosyltransferase